MAHHHHHGPCCKHGDGEGNLKVAFILNFCFTIIEIIGGLWTNSVAVLADAVHDAGDCLSLGLAWRLERVSRREGDLTYTYGYRRYSTLGAALTGIVLVVGVLHVLLETVPRLFFPQPVNAGGMIFMAVLGVGFNGLAVLRTRKGTSLNEQMASWHLLEDTLGWVVVLIGSIAMSIWHLPIIDPLLSLALSLYILRNAIKGLYRVGKVFLQAVPDGFCADTFRANALAVPGVLSVDQVHCWTLDGERHVFTAHATVKAGTTTLQTSQIKRQLLSLLPEGVEQVTIDLDVSAEEEQGVE